MVDLAKRNTLIFLGGSAIVTAVPGLSAANAPGGSLAGSALIDQSQQIADSVVQLSDDSAELSISLLLENQPMVKISNNTDKLIIVRHIHPGIVHTGDKTFDLNSLFERSAYAIGSGKSRSIAINETYSTQAEVNYPGRYNKQPLRVAHVVAQTSQHNPHEQTVNSSRSFYA